MLHLSQMNFLDLDLSLAANLESHFPQDGHLHNFIRKNSQEISKALLVKKEKANL
jgi:hypothetical protein